MRRLESGEAQGILEGRWPADFDKYATLLRLGREAGRSVRFVDPLNSSLVRTIADLARESPGIELREIADLLNLDLALARELAEMAIRDEGIDVNLEMPPPDR